MGDYGRILQMEKGEDKLSKRDNFKNCTIIRIKTIEE